MNFSPKVSNIWVYRKVTSIDLVYKQKILNFQTLFLLFVNFTGQAKKILNHPEIKKNYIYHIICEWLILKLIPSVDTKYLRT